MTKLNKAGNQRGIKTWAKISKTERSKIMSERANQLWAKIRAGSLTESK